MIKRQSRKNKYYKHESFPKRNKVLVTNATARHPFEVGGGEGICVIVVAFVTLLFWGFGYPLHSSENPWCREDIQRAAHWLTHHCNAQLARKDETVGCPTSFPTVSLIPWDMRNIIFLIIVTLSKDLEMLSDGQNVELCTLFQWFFMIDFIYSLLTYT